MRREKERDEKPTRPAHATTAKRVLLRAALLLFAGGWTLSVAIPASSQDQAPGPAPDATAATQPASGNSGRKLQDSEIQEIIRQFAAKEEEFREARGNYTYRQIVKVQELSPDGDLLGTYHMEEDVIFTPSGQRIEKVVYAPVSTLRHIGLTPEDERDLRTVQPFVLTSAELPKYDIKYQGRQKVDELNTYVFMVTPKVMEKGQRYFQGMIWVEENDYQIVKTYGKAVPDIRGKGQENLFPRFETYRQQVDGKYWFPTWTNADDTLYFSSGAQRIRMLIRYENYKQFRSATTVTYGDEVPEPKPAP